MAGAAGAIPSNNPNPAWQCLEFKSLSASLIPMPSLGRAARTERARGQRLTRLPISNKPAKPTGKPTKKVLHQ